jgi:hypothetical protein
MNRKIMVQAGPGIKKNPISKIANTKKGWLNGSSDKALP